MTRRAKVDRKKKISDWVAKGDKEAAVMEKLAKSWTLTGLLEELQVEVSLEFDQLLAFLGAVKGQHRALDDLAAAIVDSKDISKWLPMDFLLARNEDRSPTLDEILDWKGISRVEVAAGIAAAAFTRGIDKARVILGQEMPEIVRAAVSSATDPEGGGISQADRKLLFEAAGFTKSGPQTVVNVNNQQNLAVGLPKWDEADKVVRDAYFEKGVERRGLPPAQMENAVEGEIVESATAEEQKTPIGRLSEEQLA